MGVGINRVSLEFNIRAKFAFQFLIDKYGFKLIQEEATFLRYESEWVFINIYHGRLSYEIGFECGLKSKGEDSRYRLPTILRGLLGEAYSKEAVLQASEKEAILRCIVKMAELVSKHCGSLLNAEELAFAQVEKASVEESQEITEKYTIDPVKRQAEQAWRKKDYDKVKSLYRSIINKLSPIEIKRLEYASKHFKQNPHSEI